MKKIILILILIFTFSTITYAEDTTLQNSDTENNEQTEENNNENQESNTTEETNGKKSEKENNSASNNSSINLAENAKSAIMIEASTGKIIFEKNSNEKLPMASMTKMMTLLLIIENIESGNLKWNEKVTASEYASSMGGSQIFLEPGEEMTVEDLVKGLCIGSGNDVVVIKKQSQVIGEEITI